VRICKETGTQLIAVHELAIYLAGRGVDKIDPGNTGGTLHHDDFDLIFVPAWHSAFQHRRRTAGLSRRLLRPGHRSGRGEDPLSYGRYRDLFPTWG
jgi:L-ascorbate metabolism protein UlaG (beta-lactamase superfamily)